MDTASKLIPANTFCIANLVGNALKFTEQGEVCLIVRTEAAAEDRVTFSIEVKGTGIGLPVEQTATCSAPSRKFMKDLSGPLAYLE